MIAFPHLLIYFVSRSTSSKMKCVGSQCANDASFYCKSCMANFSLPNDPPIPGYCSDICQNADHSHTIRCTHMSDRTKICRVLDTAQKLWFVFQDLAWVQHEEVHRVEVSLNKLDMYLWLKVRDCFFSNMSLPNGLVEMVAY